MSALVRLPRSPVKPAGGFESDRHKATNITEADIVGELEVGTVDRMGREIGRSFVDEQGERWLVGDAYRDLVRLAEQMQKQPVLRVVSLEFLKTAIFEWMRDRV